MEISEKDSSSRVIFLDNLRYFFVLCVVLQHASNAYSGFFFTKWWPVLESASSVIVALLQIFFDVFTMPLMYFIAGYFALPSIRKHGTASFIKGKLKRLGIPWIICIFTICPLSPLIYHYTRNNLTLSASYLDIWIAVMKSAAQFNTGIINSIDELMKNDGFYQRYMWFISLLLVFFILFSICYKIKQKWFEDKHVIKTEKPSISGSLKIMTLIGLLNLFGSLILYFIMIKLIGSTNPSGLLTIGNIIQVQFMRLFPYTLYFILGIIMFRNKWIERGKFPGHLKTWMILIIILPAVYGYLMNAFMNSPVRSKEMYLYGFLSFPVYNFLTITTLGFFSSLAIKYWNRPRKIDQNLAANSYDIYLSHYVFVAVFQLILFTVPGIPALLKFVIVSVLSIICAYLASEFLSRRYPKITAALLFAMLIMMFAVIKP